MSNWLARLREFTGSTGLVLKPSRSPDRSGLLHVHPARLPHFCADSWKMRGFLGSGGELFLPMSRPLHRPPSPTWALVSWTDLYAIFKFLCCDIWFLKSAWPVFEMCLVLPLKGKCLDLNQWHVRQNHRIASSYYCTWDKNSHTQCVPMIFRNLKWGICVLKAFNNLSDLLLPLQLYSWKSSLHG